MYSKLIMSFTLFLLMVILSFSIVFRQRNSPRLNTNQPVFSNELLQRIENTEGSEVLYHYTIPSKSDEGIMELTLPKGFVFHKGDAQKISRFTGMNTLNISGTEVSDEDWETLVQLNKTGNLAFLSVNFGNWDKNKFNTMLEINTVEYLEIIGLNVSDIPWHDLSRMKKLRRITISSSDFNNEDLRSMSGLKGSENLIIKDSNVSSEECRKVLENYHELMIHLYQNGKLVFSGASP